MKNSSRRAQSFAKASVKRVDTLYAAARFEDALREMDRLPASTRSDPALLSIAASCHFNLGDLDRSEVLYRRILAQTPDCVTTLLCLGQVLKTKGEIKESARCFEQVVSLAPYAVIAYLILADFSRLERQFERAEFYARQAVFIAPQNDDAFTMLDAILLERRRFEQAQRGDNAAQAMFLAILDRWHEARPLWAANHPAG